MTDPKTRALYLVGKLTKCVAAATYDFDRVATELRLAITQIPTTNWQPMETAPNETPVRLLCQRDKAHRAFDCFLRHGSWMLCDTVYHLAHAWTPLAWRPADSTELPTDWGTP